MSKPQAQLPLSSAEKKRLRDRRAQQNLRDKKLRYTMQLEEKLAYCEQHHSDQGVQQLLRVIQGLRTQNELLLSRQEQLSRLIRSWEGETTNTNSPGAVHEPPVHQVLEEAKVLPQVRLESTIDFILSKDAHNTTSCGSASRTPSIPDTSRSSSVEIRDPCCPPWRLLPLNNDDLSSPEALPFPWFAYPERIASSPDSPSSPLDILYGTKTNPLADMIHTKLRSRPLRDPERLAVGWLIYHMSKWMFSPTPESYALIPAYLKPVLGQFQIPHPRTLDFIMWPKVRLNVIKGWPVYSQQRDDLFGLFTCCVRVRWPWGKSFLERNERNELCIRRDFYETFMRESGWGLTPEFLSTYPDIFVGMDVRDIRYELV